MHKLHSSPREKALTIVTVEERLRGWLAEINRRRELRDQITPYAKLQRQVEAFSDWNILPWDEAAAELFLKYRREGIRIGSMDLKIACITLAHDAALLTRNTIDFAQVPHLEVENWLD